MFYIICYIFVLFQNVESYLNNIAWIGGPVHFDCETSANIFKNTGQLISENIIATKAVAYKDDIYVITPRLKRGILATIWLIVRGRQGLELQAVPDLRHHAIGNCEAVQNAVDIFLDHRGNIWVLDSGIMETLESPRCTCPPKVVVINILLGKVVKRVDLSSQTTPSSLLQNIVVEYDIGIKPFVYISEASRGAILLYDTSTGARWSIVVTTPSAGLQLGLVKRAPTHHVLVLASISQPGLMELDTASVRRQNSAYPLRVYGEQSNQVLLLGSNNHQVFLRHLECTDVLAWDTRGPYNSSLPSIHSPGPRLAPTSVSADYKKTLVILDSNYADALNDGIAAYHRISFIGQ